MTGGGDGWLWWWRGAQGQVCPQAQCGLNLSWSYVPGNFKNLFVYEAMFPIYHRIWRCSACFFLVISSFLAEMLVMICIMEAAEVTPRWMTFLCSLLYLCRCTMYGHASKCDRVTMLKPAFAQEKGPKSASTADRVKVGVVKEWGYLLEKCHLQAFQLTSRKCRSEDCSPQGAG